MGCLFMLVCAPACLFVCEREGGKDTLILATADHSHVFTMAGYPTTGHSIVDKMTYEVYPKKSKRPTDGMPMSVLMYANGPGPQRTNLTGVDTTGKDFVFPNAVPTESESHGGEDVAVFARGPMSHLVGGLHEQNVLAHIMAYASCIGPDKSHCSGNNNMANFCTGGTGTSFSFIDLKMLWFVVLLVFSVVAF